MCFLCGNSVTQEEHAFALRRIAELETRLHSVVDDNALLRIEVMEQQTKVHEHESIEYDDGYYHAFDINTPTVFSVLSFITDQTTLSNPFTDLEAYEEKVQDTINKIDCNRIKEIAYKIGKQKFNTSLNSLVVEVTYTVRMTNLTIHEIDTLKKLTEGSFIDSIRTSNNEMDIVVDGKPLHLMYSFGARGDNVDQLEIELSYYVPHRDEPLNENYARTLLESLASHALYAQWSVLESKRK
ncbi:hypothetical protein [Aeromonas sp. AE23HZ002T15]